MSLFNILVFFELLINRRTQHTIGYIKGIIATMITFVLLVFFIKLVTLMSIPKSIHPVFILKLVLLKSI